MEQLLERLANCVELGKVDRDSPFPPELLGEDGAVELCQEALATGVPPEEILKGALVPAMRRVGERFEQGSAFIPELLIAARAMQEAMGELKPHFASGRLAHRGTIVIGTVAGDIHDIGKNVVRMVLEGEGWRAVDLGVDVTTERYLAALDEHPDALIAMSSLLTTTMPGMAASLRAIRERYPETSVYVGGAPVTEAFATEIGSDGTFPDPMSFARHLEERA